MESDSDDSNSSSSSESEDASERSASSESESEEEQVSAEVSGDVDQLADALQSLEIGTPETKYERARTLHKMLPKIRKNYMADLHSKDSTKRARAALIYLLDFLALRIGGVNNGLTFGCSTLLVRHAQLSRNGNDSLLSLDFPGKSGVIYKRTVKIDEAVYRCLKELTRNKEPGEQIFPVGAPDVLAYLKEQMPELQSKTFRTRTASVLFEDKLRIFSQQAAEATANREEKLLYAYRRANFCVARKLNHKHRAVPASQENKIKKLKAMMKKKLAQARAAIDPRNLESLQNGYRFLELRQTTEEQNKFLNLKSSHEYYIDPRINVAWCAKYNISIRKVFRPKLCSEVHKWAIDEADAEFKFSRNAT